MSWRAVPTSAAVFASLLTVPAAAWSSVPRSGNTFSPRDGAELVEAADAISSEGASSTSFKATIELDAHEYVVSSPVVLKSLSAPTVRGPIGGGAVITNGGAPITLLQLSSQVVPAGAGVSRVDFALTGSSALSVIAVDLQRGSALRDSVVTVPAEASKATAVRLAPSAGVAAASPLPATLERVQVRSQATAAAAVRASNGAQILDSTLEGGAPPLDVIGDASGTDRGNVLVDSSTVRSTSAGAAVPAVRVRGGGNHLRTVLWSSVVDARSGAGQLIDLGGPSASSGSVEAELGQLTLRGTPSSIGLRVRAGSGTAPLSVNVRGLLSLGSQVALDCQGPATAVSIVGVYRTGEPLTGGGCALAESGRRTGYLAWSDEAAGDLRPVWNSPLVDAVSGGGVPAPAGTHDVAGGPRFVAVRSEATPGDIGAFEYQLTPPQQVAANFLPLGNRGLTALLGEGYDPDDLEDPLLQFRWALPDGTTADGPVVLYRFSSTAPQQVTLTVVDVTGAAVQRTLTVTPNIRLDQPATDGTEGFPIGELPIPGAKPPAAEAPGPLLSAVPDPAAPLALPVIPVSPTPGLDPSLKQDFPPILKRVRARKRRIRTNRRTQPQFKKARRGEAEFSIETWRKSEMFLEVSTVLEGQGLTAGLPVATYELKPFKGTKVLRVGAKLGRTKLRPGLYLMAIAAYPRPGAVPERTSFFVRVLRKK